MKIKFDPSTWPHLSSSGGRAMWGLVLQQPPRLELVTTHLSLQVTLLLILKIPDHLGIAFCQLLVLLWNVPAAQFCPHYVARPPALLSPCALRPLTLQRAAITSIRPDQS